MLLPEADDDVRWKSDSNRRTNTAGSGNQRRRIASSGEICYFLDDRNLMVDKGGYLCNAEMVEFMMCCE